jgi:hypothetical protein
MNVLKLTSSVEINSPHRLKLTPLTHTHTHPLTAFRATISHSAPPKDRLVVVRAIILLFFLSTH